MATIRDQSWESSHGGSSITVTLPTTEAGDTLVVIVAGGNRATSWSSGWKYYEYFTGWEAQGVVLSKSVAADDTDVSTLTVNFDGGDPRSVYAVSVVGIVEISFPFADRFGVAGSSFDPSSSDPITFDAGVGDVLLSYAFARNATDVPRASRGTLAGSTTPSSNAGSSGVAYSEEILFGAPVAQLFAYPGRSGHYSIVVQLWEWGSRTSVDHVYQIEPTSVSPSAVWKPSLHTLVATSTGTPADDVFEFNLHGDFTALPIVGVRVEQTITSGLGYLELNFQSITEMDYFSADTSAIWQYGSAYNAITGMYLHSIPNASYNSGDFSVFEMVRRIAYEGISPGSPDPHPHADGSLDYGGGEGSITTTLRVIAYEEPQVILTPMSIVGQEDSTRVRPYRPR